MSPELLTTDGFDDDLSAEQLFEVTESYNEENFSGEMKLEDGHGVDKFKFSDSPPPQVVPNVPSFTKNKKIQTKKKNNEKQKVFIRVSQTHLQNNPLAGFCTSFRPLTF